MTTLPNMCLGCLTLKPASGHTCPPYLKEGGNSKRFCAICKLNSKLCKMPGSHTRGVIPATFAGHGRVDHEAVGEAAVWTYECVNRGSLGSASLLTSTLTLVNGEDTITVEALWDPGSE